MTVKYFLADLLNALAGLFQKPQLQPCPVVARNRN